MLESRAGRGFEFVGRMFRIASSLPFLAVLDYTRVSRPYLFGTRSGAEDH